MAAFVSGIKMQWRHVLPSAFPSLLLQRVHIRNLINVDTVSKDLYQVLNLCAGIRISEWHHMKGSRNSVHSTNFKNSSGNSDHFQWSCFLISAWYFNGVVSLCQHDVSLCQHGGIVFFGT